MPPWPRRSRRRNVCRRDGAAARRRTTLRAGSVATATTSSSGNVKRGARAGRPAPTVPMPLSAAPASARTAHVDRPLAVPPAFPARSTRIAAQGSVDALNSCLVPRVARAATPPARSPGRHAPLPRTAAPSFVLTLAPDWSVPNPDQRVPRPVWAAASSRLLAI